MERVWRARISGYLNWKN